MDLFPGEILAVIGDNGAGKSTLVKASSGALVPDGGEIRLNGASVKFHGPADTRRHGIETVYQDLALASAMSVAENLFLGRETRRAGVLGSVFRLLDKPRMMAEAASHLQSLQIGIRSMTEPNRVRHSYRRALSAGQFCTSTGRPSANATVSCIPDSRGGARELRDRTLGLRWRVFRNDRCDGHVASHVEDRVENIRDRIGRNQQADALEREAGT